MKISKVLHVLSVISGVLGLLMFFGLWGANSMNMMYQGMYSQGSMMGAGMNAAIFFLIAIWLQVATIHHMMLEKKGEIV